MDPHEPSGGDPRPVLVLLNGLPGAGKSAVAAELARQHPGTLRLDIDLLRSLVRGPDAPGIARDLALTMADRHLRGGRDVVVPQLVARVDQARRFVDVAVRAGARFAHVTVVAPDVLRHERVLRDAAEFRADLDADREAGYERGIADVERSIGLTGVLDTAAPTATPAAAARRLAGLVRTVREQPDQGSGQVT